MKLRNIFFSISALLLLLYSIHGITYATLNAVCGTDYGKASFQDAGASAFGTDSDYLKQNTLDSINQGLNSFYFQNPFTNRTTNTGAPVLTNPLNQYNPDLAYIMGNNGNFTATNTDGRSYSDSCVDINQMCVNSSELVPNKDNVHGAALPTNTDTACYSYCQCGIMVGNIELQTIYESGSPDKQIAYYKDLLFLPTGGGEISDIYPYISKQYDFPLLTGSLRQLGKSNGLQKLFTPVTASLPRIPSVNGIPDNALAQPNTPINIPVAGKAGYFCGFAHNGTETNISQSTKQSASWTDASKFDQNFPGLSDQSILIGADVNAYLSRSFGHGIDIQSDPTTDIASYTQSTHQKDIVYQLNLKNIPTVCMNLDIPNNQAGVTSSNNNGLIKFATVRGGIDCNQVNVPTELMGTYFTCRFDNHESIRQCDAGTHFDGSVLWGWPCSPNGQSDANGTPIPTPTPDPNLKKVAQLTYQQNITYDGWPLVYSDQMVNNNPANLSPNAYFKQPGANDYKCSDVNNCITAIGPIKTNLNEFLGSLMAYVLGFGGAIALILIIMGGYELLASEGNPDKVKAARERITSAIIGLLFMIFSGVFLQVLGVDILNLPGLGK